MKESFLLRDNLCLLVVETKGTVLSSFYLFYDVNKSRTKSQDPDHSKPRGPFFQVSCEVENQNLGTNMPELCLLQEEGLSCRLQPESLSKRVRELLHTPK